jgi:hypothetical protein
LKLYFFVYRGLEKIIMQDQTRGNHCSESDDLANLFTPEQKEKIVHLETFEISKNQSKKISKVFKNLFEGLREHIHPISFDSGHIGLREKYHFHPNRLLSLYGDNIDHLLNETAMEVCKVPNGIPLEESHMTALLERYFSFLTERERGSPHHFVMNPESIESLLESDENAILNEFNVFLDDGRDFFEKITFATPVLNGKSQTWSVLIIEFSHLEEDLLQNGVIRIPINSVNGLYKNLKVSHILHEGDNQLSLQEKSKIYNLFLGEDYERETSFRFNQVKLFPQIENYASGHCAILNLFRFLINPSALYLEYNPLDLAKHHENNQFVAESLINGSQTILYEFSEALMNKVLEEKATVVVEEYLLNLKVDNYCLEEECLNLVAFLPEVSSICERLSQQRQRKIKNHYTAFFEALALNTDQTTTQALLGAIELLARHLPEDEKIAYLENIIDSNEFLRGLLHSMLNPSFFYKAFFNRPFEDSLEWQSLRTYFKQIQPFDIDEFVEEFERLEIEPSNA